MNYKHTQTGYFIIFILIALFFFFGYILSIADFAPNIFAITLLVMFILISFTTLKVTVDESYVRIKFGYGIFWKKFSLNEIVSASTVKNHWYYGWGIRLWLWPKMVIFNVSGLDAVEIKMTNGKVYRIGTDEPKQLERAICRQLNGKIIDYANH